MIGLSHLVQPRLWVRFFDLARQTGVAAWIIPMDTLPIGVILIVGHNVWVWDWPLALTVAGWAMTIKCTLYLLVPQTADRVLDRNVAKTSRGYQASGIVMMLLGGVLTWQAWSGEFYLFLG